MNLLFILISYVPRSSVTFFISFFLFPFSFFVDCESLIRFCLFFSVCPSPGECFSTRVFVLVFSFDVIPFLLHVLLFYSSIVLTFYGSVIFLRALITEVILLSAITIYHSITKCRCNPSKSSLFVSRNVSVLS
jgi:hypothetical protein